MWYDNTSVVMTKIQNINTTKCWQGCGAARTLIHCWWECKMVHPLWNSLALTYKIQHTSTIQPLLHFVFTQRSWNLCPHKNMHMDIYRSFIHNCQNLDITKIFFSKWMINKLWYIHTIEYYSTVKRKLLSSYEKTWGNLKHILLNKRS